MDIIRRFVFLLQGNIVVGPQMPLLSIYARSRFGTMLAARISARVTVVVAGDGRM